MIVALVQARMASTRLPGKVLAEIVGRPMLWRVVTRVGRARLVDKVVVATSVDPSDDPVADYCSRQGFSCFRGSHDDVLDRYRRAAKDTGADVVVRVTADCPFVDPHVADRVIAAYLEGDCDYATNTLRYTYPDGLDVEVFSRDALELAWAEARKPSEREHVTPYIRLSGKFRLRNVARESGPSLHGQRWTVDKPEDLEWARAVYSGVGRDHFCLEDVLALLEENPHLMAIQGATVLNEGYYRSLYRQAPEGAASPRRLEQSRLLLERSEKVIPGCAQTFSKSYNQYVKGVSPVFLERGAGCRVWDVDGNSYIDYVQGLLPNVLGYAHPEVNAAVADQLGRGHSFSLPHPLEVELAERLTRLIPCAEMVRFGKNGSDATAGAVRAARAHTGRDRVACCGYHGWQDWYIGSTSRSAGVPPSVRALTHPFAYNDLASLEKILKEHPEEFAAVILEPVNFVEPAPGFLEGVRRLAHEHGALLIFDEICSGFHFGLGGAQKLFGVTPDLACFGKALANGFPLACVVGRADVMHVFEEVFFSFTFGGEVASIAAAIKVLDILETTPALKEMEARGSRVKDGLNQLSKEAGLQDRIQCAGFPRWSLLRFRGPDGRDSLLERSLFQQEAVKRGLLILVTHNMTAAHDDPAIEETLEIYAAVLKTLASWLSDPDPRRHLEGAMIQPVFKVR